MTTRQRVIDACNQVGEEMGDYPALVRADYEDALIQALDDTLLDGRLAAFRGFLERWGRRVGWDREVLECLRSQDGACWLTVHLLTCSLRRMMPRWEYSANVLWRMGITPPSGMEELRT